MGKVRYVDEGREWTGTDAEAECLTCGWTCGAKNAHAIGARHARSHKHNVRVTVEQTNCYQHAPGGKWG